MVEGCHHYGEAENCTDVTAKERARQQWVAAGHEHWWHWCIAPTDPAWLNAFVERPAIEGRLLFWLSALHAISGMLHCMVDIWSVQCPTFRPCTPIARVNGTSMTDFNPATWNGGGSKTGGDVGLPGGANGDGVVHLPGAPGHGVFDPARKHPGRN